MTKEYITRCLTRTWRLSDEKYVFLFEEKAGGEDMLTLEVTAEGGCDFTLNALYRITMEIEEL